MVEITTLSFIFHREANRWHISVVCLCLCMRGPRMNTLDPLFAMNFVPAKKNTEGWEGEGVNDGFLVT